MSHQKKYHTLVISGGDIKGVYALGALHHIYSTYPEKVDKISKYVGTSIGALICYLLIIGYTPFELIEYIVHSTFLDDLKNLNLANLVQRKGMLNYYIIQEHLEGLTVNKIGKFMTLADLYLKTNKELVCTTYNYTTGELEYLSYRNSPDLPALTAVRMSCNIPILFDRFFYNGYEYIDGGFGNNFPIDKAIKEDEVKGGVLGLYLDGQLRRSDSSDNNIAKFIVHLLLLPSHIEESSKIDKYAKVADIITIISDKFHLLDFDMTIGQRLNCVSTGIKAAQSFYESVTNDGDSSTKEEKSPSIVSLLQKECMKTVVPYLLSVINGQPDKGLLKEYVQGVIPAQGSHSIEEVKSVEEIKKEVLEKTENTEVTTPLKE